MTRGRPYRPPDFIHKPLEALTPEEWEALCDGCGRCCLVRLEDEDTGRIYATSVICALWDTEKGGCRDYANRFSRMPDCLRITPEVAARTPWLPETCAYRRRARGEPLPSWHPLLTGDPESVHRAGASVLGRVVSEEAVPLEELPEHICDWLSPPDDFPVDEREGAADTPVAAKERGKCEKA
jgi:hypothetical protein